MAAPFATQELDATDLTPAALREIEHVMASYGMGKGGRAFIINEAHGLRKDTIRQLLVVLERLPDHVVVVFTTTCEGEGQLFDTAQPVRAVPDSAQRRLPAAGHAPDGHAR